MYGQFHMYAATYDTSLAANGQAPVVIFPYDDPGPTRVPLVSIPHATILYATPQCSELTVTIAISPVMGAVPEMTDWYLKVLFCCTYHTYMS